MPRPRIRDNPLMARRDALLGTLAGAFVSAASFSQVEAQTMNTTFSVERVTVMSSKPFESVVASFDSMIGHPDMNAFRQALGCASTFAEIEQVVGRAIGKSGFMEFVHYDLGLIQQKEKPESRAKSLRYLIGNPFIMKEMVKHVPDAGSYTPLTVLIDERPDAVHLSYDTMASFLAPHGNAAALKIARDLDAKVGHLLKSAG